MVDIVDKATRSRMMSGIRSSNTKPEILTRKALHSLGYRYRLGSRVGKIKPDIVLTRYKVAIFVHGCFWHQHQGCKHAYSDRQRSDKWLKKFADNKERDKRVTATLLQKDWRVAVLWECVTRNSVEFEKEINILEKWIKADTSDYYETSYKKK